MASPPSVSTADSDIRPSKKPRVNGASSAQSKQIATLFAKNPEIKASTAVLPRTTADLPPPPEIVQNVQGSSAGAGSGEFHVYKASRRREYERLKLMEEEAKREEDEKEWARKQAENEKKDKEKLGKNQKRRAKARERKERKDGGDQADGSPKKMGVNPALKRKAADEDDTTATPMVDEAVAEESGGITILDDD